MMKIVFITGDHLRHRYMSQSLSDNSHEIYRVFQKREDIIPQSSSDMDKNLEDIFKSHSGLGKDLKSRCWVPKLNSPFSRNLQF
mgnify:CR=1 FL=1